MTLRVDPPVEKPERVFPFLRGEWSLDHQPAEEAIRPFGTKLERNISRLILGA